LTGVDVGSVAVADYDNDGLLDILLTGYDGNSNFLFTTLAKHRQWFYEHRTVLASSRSVVSGLGRLRQ